jgi:hypothetical protein
LARGGNDGTMPLGQAANHFLRAPVGHGSLAQAQTNEPWFMSRRQ